jgi:hypothetical protein
MPDARTRGAISRSLRRDASFHAYKVSFFVEPHLPHTIHLPKAIQRSYLRITGRQSVIEAYFKECHLFLIENSP